MSGSVGIECNFSRKQTLTATSQAPSASGFQEALIEAGLALPDQSLVDDGMESLAWVTERQTAAGGQFRPIGSQGFAIAYGHLLFDQQPLEARAAIDAAGAAYLATGEADWPEHAELAWNWFGSNDRGAVAGDLACGRSFDGVNPRGANLNCRAESILAFHLSCYSRKAMAELRAIKATEEGAGNRQTSALTTLMSGARDGRAIKESQMTKHPFSRNVKS